ncbi:MAG TPA: flagellar biosynthesis protein FlhF [Rudaea sp.]|jgi:flagellar biosynthesis protein FlhF|nr:flagellar biosynthesis protein FlhF [Rudaea sp.]
MKIKRFVAPDMRTAFSMVRDEQGPNAVILSNRRVDGGGVEVIAATDYDEALVRQAVRSATVTAPTMKREPVVDMPKAVEAEEPKTDMRNLWSHDPNLAEVRRELNAMRQVIAREVGRFSEDRLRDHPVRANALEELMEYGCENDLARSIATLIPKNADQRRARGLQLGILAKSLIVSKHEPIENGGVIALIGPTGVGKTTTLAKLAARYARTHSARDVALITTDVYRIGAREQLYTYGRLLGMPVVEAADENALGEALVRLKDYKLVLIDTAGLSQRDSMLANQLSWLAKYPQISSYLVMPANAQTRDLDEVIHRFGIAKPKGAILTKLDETGRLGSALSLTIRRKLPIAYVTDGQRVPEDLHRADQTKLALRVSELRQASKFENPEEVHVAA